MKSFGVGVDMCQEEILVVYDKQCPACHNFCQHVEAREGVGALTLVDARDDTEVMSEITAKGLDIDEGMGWEKEVKRHYRNCKEYGFSQVKLGN